MIEPNQAALVLNQLYRQYRRYLKLKREQKVKVGGFAGLVNKNFVKGIGNTLARKGNPIHTYVVWLNRFRVLFGGWDHIEDDRRELIEEAYQTFIVAIERWRRDKHQKYIINLRQLAARGFSLDDFTENWEDFSRRVRLLADEVPAIRESSARETQFARDLIVNHQVIPEGPERQDVEALLVFLDGQCQAQTRGDISGPLYHHMHAALMRQGLTRSTFIKDSPHVVDIPALVRDLAAAYAAGTFDSFTFPAPGITDPAASWGVREEALQAMAGALKGSRYLREFRFDGSGMLHAMTDTGMASFCRALGKCRFLLQLSVTNHELSQVGIKSLAEILPRMIHFHDLDLTGNHLEGAGSDALAQALPKLKELSDLNLTNCRLTNADVVTLTNAIVKSQYLNHVNLSKNPIDEQAAVGVARLIAGNHVKVVSLSDCAVGDEGAKIIAAALRLNSSLKEIHFNNCDLGNTGADALRKSLKASKRTVAIDLSDNQIEVSAQESFSRIQELTEQMETLIAGEPCLQEGHRIMEAIQRLGVRDPKLAPKLRLGTIKALEEGLRKIHAMQQEQGQPDPTCFNQELYQIYMKYFPDHVLAHNLTYFGQGKPSRYLQRAIEDGLREHELMIGDEGARVLGDKLIHTRLITRLSLKNQYISEVGAEFLGAALMRNYSLVHLDLEDNLIQDEGLSSLAQGVARNAMLKWLNLQNCGAYLKGFEDLAKALRINRVLAQLELQENAITEQAVIALMASLELNTGLRVFSLSGATIGSNAAQAIASTLSKNRHLTDFRLKNSEISDENAVIIADGLKKNRVLKQVMFKNCALQDDGALVIDRALKEHPEIEHLDLTQNQINSDTKGMIMIRTGYRYYKSL